MRISKIPTGSLSLLKNTLVQSKRQLMILKLNLKILLKLMFNMVELSMSLSLLEVKRLAQVVKKSKAV